MGLNGALNVYQLGKQQLPSALTQRIDWIESLVIETAFGKKKH
jgi:hypothetical protein